MYPSGPYIHEKPNVKKKSYGFSFQEGLNQR